MLIAKNAPNKPHKTHRKTNKMQENYCDINVVLDKSGSMGPLQKETIEGYNKFIADQKALPGKCLVTLTQFDTSFLVTYSGVDIQRVEPLTSKTYCPGGYTALLDAIGRTIQAASQRFEAMPEADRPGKVVMLIMTDGEENSSKEFAKGKINEMIKTQTDAFKWNFVFLGANQDAIQTGGAIGVSCGNTMSFAASGEGVKAAYHATSSNIADFRTSTDPDADSKLCYSHDQRKAQRDAGATADSLNS